MFQKFFNLLAINTVVGGIKLRPHGRSIGANLSPHASQSGHRLDDEIYRCQRDIGTSSTSSTSSSGTSGSTVTPDVGANCGNNNFVTVVHCKFSHRDLGLPSPGPNLPTLVEFGGHFNCRDHSTCANGKLTKEFQIEDSQFSVTSNTAVPVGSGKFKLDSNTGFTSLQGSFRLKSDSDSDVYEEPMTFLVKFVGNSNKPICSYRNPSSSTSQNLSRVRLIYEIISDDADSDQNSKKLFLFGPTLNLVNTPQNFSFKFILNLNLWKSKIAEANGEIPIQSPKEIEAPDSDTIITQDFDRPGAFGTLGFSAKFDSLTVSGNGDTIPSNLWASRTATHLQTLNLSPLQVQHMFRIIIEIFKAQSVNLNQQPGEKYDLDLPLMLKKQHDDLDEEFKKYCIPCRVIIDGGVICQVSTDRVDMLRHPEGTFHDEKLLKEREWQQHYTKGAKEFNMKGNPDWAREVIKDYEASRQQGESKFEEVLENRRKSGTGRVTFSDKSEFYFRGINDKMGDLVSLNDYFQSQWDLDSLEKKIKEYEVKLEDYIFNSFMQEKDLAIEIPDLVNHDLDITDPDDRTFIYNFFLNEVKPLYTEISDLYDPGEFQLEPDGEEKEAFDEALERLSEKTGSGSSFDINDVPPGEFAESVGNMIDAVTKCIIYKLETARLDRDNKLIEMKEHYRKVDPFWNKELNKREDQVVIQAIRDSTQDNQTKFAAATGINGLLSVIFAGMKVDVETQADSEQNRKLCTFTSDGDKALISNDSEKKLSSILKPRSNLSILAEGRELQSDTVTTNTRPDFYYPSFPNVRHPLQPETKPNELVDFKRLQSFFFWEEFAVENTHRPGTQAKFKIDLNSVHFENLSNQPNVIETFQRQTFSIVNIMGRRHTIDNHDIEKQKVSNDESFTPFVELKNVLLPDHAEVQPNIYVKIYFDEINSQVWHDDNRKAEYIEYAYIVVDGKDVEICSKKKIREKEFGAFNFYIRPVG